MIEPLLKSCLTLRVVGNLAKAEDTAFDFAAPVPASLVDAQREIGSGILELAARFTGRRAGSRSQTWGTSSFSKGKCLRHPLVPRG